MKKNKEVLYEPPEEICMEEYNGCCGVEIATGFDMFEQGVYEKGVTKEEWHKMALKEIEAKRTKKHVQLSIVTKYKTKGFTSLKSQCDGFKEYLESKGWNVITTFVNPNHGNTVCVLGKTYARVKTKPNAHLFAARW